MFAKRFASFLPFSRLAHSQHSDQLQATTHSPIRRVPAKKKLELTIGHWLTISLYTHTHVGYTFIDQMNVRALARMLLVVAVAVLRVPDNVIRAWRLCMTLALYHVSRQIVVSNRVWLWTACPRAMYWFSVIKAEQINGPTANLISFIWWFQNWSAVT